VLRVDLTATIITSDGTERACVVTTIDGVLVVLDAETLEPVRAPPDVLLIERPE
jgi:hypothetical protein